MILISRGKIIIRYIKNYRILFRYTSLCFYIVILCNYFLYPTCKTFCRFQSQIVSVQQFCIFTIFIFCVRIWLSNSNISLSFVAWTTVARSITGRFEDVMSSIHSQLWLELTWNKSVWSCLSHHCGHLFIVVILSLVFFSVYDRRVNYLSIPISRVLQSGAGWALVIRHLLPTASINS